eukprot:2156-Heterococcus_DN1.PRE.1
MISCAIACLLTLSYLSVAPLQSAYAHFVPCCCKWASAAATLPAYIVCVPAAASVHLSAKTDS